MQAPQNLTSNFGYKCTSWVKLSSNYTIYDYFPFIRHYLESPCLFLFNRLVICLNLTGYLALRWVQHRYRNKSICFSNPLKKIPNVLICLETTGYFTLPFRNVPGSTLTENLGWTMDEKKIKQGLRLVEFFDLNKTRFLINNYHFWHITGKFQNNHNTRGLWKNKKSEN